MYERLLGLGTNVQMNRTHHSTENSYAERLIGTIQFGVLNFLPGYTGSRPGQLNGYDGKKEAKITSDDLMGFITRYLVDEYPHRPHRGTGMYHMTPRAKLEASVREYGEIEAPDWETRRLHLGEQRVVTTTSEGVRIFGIWYNSSKLQKFTGGKAKKVTVCLDPDDLREVTIFSAETQEKMTAELRMGDFADMTLEEAIEVMRGAVEDNPDSQRIDEERLRASRARRAAESGFFPDPRKPVNFQTIQQLETQVAQIGNVEFIPMPRTIPTVSPGSIMDLPDSSESVRPIEERGPVGSEEAADLPGSTTDTDAPAAASPETPDPQKPKTMFAPITKSKL